MKRQRVKVLCKAKNCGAEFNSDYRLQHNRKQHGGRNVPFEAVGAPRILLKQPNAEIHVLVKMKQHFKEI